MRTHFERQQQLFRIDRWLQDFHRRAPILFFLMCAGMTISLFGLTLLLIDIGSHLVRYQ